MCATRFNSPRGSGKDGQRGEMVERSVQVAPGDSPRVMGVGLVGGITVKTQILVAHAIWRQEKRLKE